MSRTKSIKDVDLSGKRVFVRCDFNVPLTDGQISDDSRIVAALPTIKHLVAQGAKVILSSHLGRPKGEPNAKYSLAPVAEELAAQLGQPVTFIEDCIGESVEAEVAQLADGEVALLENVRFYKGETDNDPEFAASLAKLADAFVNDAFGTAHRAHASTAGVAAHLSPCVCGLLIEKELAYLGDKTNHPERPLTVILGGAKVSDKINVIDALLETPLLLAAPWLTPFAWH
jgi:phosphoglycerate kinase